MREHICHHVAFPGDVPDVACKFRYERQVASLSRGPICVAGEGEREGFVVGDNGEGLSFKKVAKVSDCRIYRQQLTIESRILLLCLLQTPREECNGHP